MSNIVGTSDILVIKNNDNLCNQNLFRHTFTNQILIYLSGLIAYDILTKFYVHNG